MNDSLFSTGIRPLVDAHLDAKAKEIRDYGKYWSASSAGYCMRKVMFQRLQVPPVKPDPRKQRVFAVGHIFHQWLQEITKAAGISIAQELELQDERLMIRGHIDDLVLVDAPIYTDRDPLATIEATDWPPKHLILYDFKTQNSRAFSYDRPMSKEHQMQLGTYIYMLRNELGKSGEQLARGEGKVGLTLIQGQDLTEARILLVSKDDLRMKEKQLFWTPTLEKDIYSYWSTLNGYWEAYVSRGVLPRCTCADSDNGWAASEKYNDYFYMGEPCSEEYFRDWEAKNKKEVK